MSYFTEADKRFLWNFSRSASFKRELVSLRETGSILVPPAYEIRPIKIKEVNWKFYNDHQPGFQWWLNGMKYLRPLLAEGIAQATDIELAAEFIRDWVEKNPFHEPLAKFAWDGHATAIRAEHLAALYAIGYRNEWLVESIHNHASVLMSDNFHQGNWNHGLDQDIGLLSLGGALSNNEWIELARARALFNFESSVDEEGVSNEQAVGYQYYVFLRFNDLKERLACCGFPMEESKTKRLHGMLEFCTHAVAPDGCWSQLGDTLLVKAEDDATDLLNLAPDSSLVYAVTGGQKGVEPDATYKIFKAGFAFGRTAWINEINKAANYYSLRFGPGRQVHGHNDHMSLTYHHQNERVFIDGGFHGYTADFYRDHFRRPEAHNLVIKQGVDRFLWDEPTELLKCDVFDDYQVYKLRDKPYKEVVRERCVLFLIKHGVILVLDKVFSKSFSTYYQLWNLDKSFNVWSVNRESIQLRNSRFSTTIKQLWPYDDLDIFHSSDQPARGWAGYGRYELHPVPTLSFAKSGKLVTYLTAISVGDVSKEEFIFSQKPIKRHGINRLLSVACNNEIFEFLVTEDGYFQKK